MRAREESLTASSHYAINACLAPLCSLHLVAVTTVEGIGSVARKLHPVQVRKKNNNNTYLNTKGHKELMFLQLKQIKNLGYYFKIVENVKRQWQKQVSMVTYGINKCLY